MTGGTNYWYVLRSSPIHAIGDIAGKIVGYETNGSSSQYDAIDFLRKFGLNAKLALTGGANATFNHLKAGISILAGALPRLASIDSHKAIFKSSRARTTCRSFETRPPV